MNTPETPTSKKEYQPMVEIVTEIDRTQLAALIEHNRVIVVETLPEHVFDQGHLPGAVNIRPRKTDELAPQLLPDREASIVVYCGSETCDASLRVAKRLQELGYQDVHRYTGGKQDWIAAGLPIEGATQPEEPGPCS
jgi:rhodanese-related sulfurtransferase